MRHIEGVLSAVATPNRAHSERPSRRKWYRRPNIGNAFEVAFSRAEQTVGDTELETRTKRIGVHVVSEDGFERSPSRGLRGRHGAGFASREHTRNGSTGHRLSDPSRHRIGIRESFPARSTGLLPGGRKHRERPTMRAHTEESHGPRGSRTNTSWARPGLPTRSPVRRRRRGIRAHSSGLSRPGRRGFPVHGKHVSAIPWWHAWALRGGLSAGRPPELVTAWHIEGTCSDRISARKDPRGGPANGLRERLSVGRHGA